MDRACCAAWAKAQESGTDNEQYENLLYRGNPANDPGDSDLGGRWYIGSTLPPVRFCPWCGAAKG